MNELSLASHPKAPPVGIKLTGSIDNPKRENIYGALLFFTGAKIGSKLLEGTAIGGILNVLTGGGTSAQPAPPAPPADDSQPAGELPPPVPLQPLPAQPFENLIDLIIQGSGN